MTNSEQREDEFLCLESLLSPEEFQKTSEGSGILEIYAFTESGYDVVVVDTVEKLHRLDEWISAAREDSELANDQVDDVFKFLHLRLTHLPPIRVKYALPESYPSDAPPDVSISCSWIPRRLILELELHVKTLWEQNGRQAVLYELFQFVSDQASTGALFGYSDWCIPILCREKLALPATAQSMLEAKNFLLVSNAEKLLRSIENYNENRTVILFQQGSHRCNICFESHPGTEFIRLTNCKHFVCKQCMEGLCVNLIKDGAVQRLQCMECSTELNPFDIEASVTPEVWEKCQKFQLDSALSTMEDVVYCPRPWCNQAVIKEGESSAGRCPGCAYVFCIHCRRGYHGIEPCPLDAEKRLVAQEYQAADPRRKADMEKRFGQMRLRHLVDEVKAEDWVSANAKPCPKCKFPVQKMGGCNKMVCTKCASPFCWLCSAKLTMSDPYDHFRDPANKDCYMKLMLGIEAEEEERDRDFDVDEEEDWNDEDLRGRWFGVGVRPDGELVLRELREVLGAAVALLDRL